MRLDSYIVVVVEGGFPQSSTPQRYQSVTVHHAPSRAILSHYVLLVLFHIYPARLKFRIIFFGGAGMTSRARPAYWKTDSRTSDLRPDQPLARAAGTFHCTAYESSMPLRTMTVCRGTYAYTLIPTWLCPLHFLTRSRHSPRVQSKGRTFFQRCTGVLYITYKVSTVIPYHYIRRKQRCKTRYATFTLTD
jgi:hypothetical protein